MWLAPSNDAIPIELLREEQQKVSMARTAIEKRLEQLGVSVEELKAHAAAALHLAENCATAYGKASPRERRLINRPCLNASSCRKTAPFD